MSTDQLHPQAREIIGAVLEAIAIPYPASAGDEPAYLKTLGSRIITLKVALGLAIERETTLDLDWSLAYLREQLAKPECAVDYETDYARVLERLPGR